MKNFIVTRGMYKPIWCVFDLSSQERMPFSSIELAIFNP
jgi:hypothetical protein